MECLPPTSRLSNPRQLRVVADNTAVDNRHQPLIDHHQLRRRSSVTSVSVVRRCRPKVVVDFIDGRLRRPSRVTSQVTAIRIRHFVASHLPTFAVVVVIDRVSPSFVLRQQIAAVVVIELRRSSFVVRRSSFVGCHRMFSSTFSSCSANGERTNERTFDRCTFASPIWNYRSFKMKP